MTGKRGDTFYVVKKALGADRALRKIAETQKVLARIDVVEEGPDMKLPAADAVKRFAHKHIDKGELVPGAKPDYKVTFNIEQPAETVLYEINGKVFDPKTIAHRMKLGTCEQWELSSQNANHPFHIHVNPFEVITTDPKTGRESGIWHDTLLVRDTDPPVTIRSRFLDFDGKSVIHCHILESTKIRE